MAPTQEQQSQQAKRLFYMDNLRVYLTSLVVLHHVAVGYGGSGGWPIRETPTDSVSPILFLLFKAINQSYFMSLFFLLAGYFLPRSYDRKGPLRCMGDRLIRLGIPLLAYIVLIAPLIRYVVVNIVQGQKTAFSAMIAHFIDQRIVSVGPLWFVEALLGFSLLYILCRAIKDRLNPGGSFTPFAGAFPNNRAIVWGIAAITLATFGVRLWFPVGEMLLHFQPGHFIHYAFCFGMGILAYRSGWIEHLAGGRVKVWRRTALATIGCLPTMVAFAMLYRGGIEPFLGGFAWEAFVTAAWESTACVSIIIVLVHFFRQRLNRPDRRLALLSANAYTVYIIHALVITTLMALLFHAAIPTAGKFLVVALIGLPACWALSHFIIRRIPGARRVLG